MGSLDCTVVATPKALFYNSFPWWCVKTHVVQECHELTTVAWQGYHGI